MKPTFFKTAADFRAWLEANHDKAEELWVGYYKKDSGKPSMDWPESVDQALCFGWIDGRREKVDDDSYMNRFTPRKPTSRWSAVNIKKVEALIEKGLMHPAGLAAFEKRTAEGSYSYEERNEAALNEAEERELRTNPKAWEYFQAQPPFYRKNAIFWVISAKKDETRRKRLAQLIDDSQHGRPIPPLTRRGKP